MEHLTKQQIVLLTLFTTFVTSIATGIVTVSLVDQAPVGVTGTVERVIEHTVDEVDSSGSSDNNSASASDAASSVSGNGAGISADPLASATALVQKSLVKIKLLSDANGGYGATDDSKITGLGIVVSKTGIVVTDKSAIAIQGNYVAVMPDGNTVPLTILESQNDGDIVFLAAQASPVSVPASSSSTTTSTPEKFSPATIADISGAGAPVLGQSVAVISGAGAPFVNEGIIQKIPEDASSTPSSYIASIDPSDTILGTPLFDLSGEIIGIKTFSLESSATSDVYYPFALLKPVIPAVGH